MNQSKLTKMVKATLLYHTAVEWPDELGILAAIAQLEIGFDLTEPARHPEGWSDGVDEAAELNWVWEAVEYYGLQFELDLWTD